MDYITNLDPEFLQEFEAEMLRAEADETERRAEENTALYCTELEPFPIGGEAFEDYGEICQTNLI